jgi:hypothetical protein
VGSSSPVRESGVDSNAPGDEKNVELREAMPIDQDKATAVSSQPRRPSRRQAPKATVQTTLALTDDPAFTICKDCDMLYNPLNEKDKKDHTRRHATALRKKREKETAAAEE